MKYQVVFEEGLLNLEKEVNKLIDQGYKPQGGVSLSRGGNSIYYTQAMIKE